MVWRCKTCKKTGNEGLYIVDKNGKVRVDEIECEPCREKRIKSKWKYSKIYNVTVLQRGFGAGSGRRPKNETVIPIWFTPEIPILPSGNRDYIYLDKEEHYAELIYIKKGTKIKLSFYWDEHGRLKLKEVGV